MAAMFLAMVWHARRRVAAPMVGGPAACTNGSVEFIRDASHNLRTPITVARGYAELVRTAHASSQTGEDAEMVLGELQKLTRISERLLTLVRSERPDFLRRTELDLEELVNQDGQALDGHGTAALAGRGRRRRGAAGRRRAARIGPRRA